MHGAGSRAALDCVIGSGYLNYKLSVLHRTNETCCILHLLIPCTGSIQCWIVEFHAFLVAWRPNDAKPRADHQLPTSFLPPHNLIITCEQTCRRTSYLACLLLSTRSWPIIRAESGQRAVRNEGPSLSCSLDQCCQGIWPGPFWQMATSRLAMHLHRGSCQALTRSSSYISSASGEVLEKCHLK